jgi:hypothetical protein
VTDAIEIALIAATPVTITSVGALILGWLNRTKLGTVYQKVDGELSEVKAELKSANEALLKLASRQAIPKMRKTSK